MRDTGGRLDCNSITQTAALLPYVPCTITPFGPHCALVGCVADVQVLYTRGTPQLWKATYSAGKLVRASNAASQDLDPAGRTVVNRAEYLGDKLWVTASGTYQPLVSVSPDFMHCWQLRLRACAAVDILRQHKTCCRSLGQDCRAQPLGRSAPLLLPGHSRHSTSALCTAAASVATGGSHSLDCAKAPGCNPPVGSHSMCSSPPAVPWHPHSMLSV